MARTPSMSAAEAEALLGPRGHLNVTADNRLTVRKWLTTQGFPSLFVGGLSMTELGLAYNRTDGSQLAKLRDKLNEARENGADIPDEEPQAPISTATNALEKKSNGHDTAAIETIRNLLLGGWTPPAPALDEKQIRSIVADALDKQEPRVIEIKQAGFPAVRIDARLHPVFERVLKHLNQGLKVMLVGPAGCGKTTLAKQLAKALSVDYGILSGSAGVSEGAVVGRLLPTGEHGKFEYQPSAFVAGYERGNFLQLFDEIDGFDSNMLLSINAAIENGHFPVELRTAKPICERGERVFILASANTYGTGANPIYCGRNPMDEATRDRFTIIEMDYDTALEREIATAGGLSDAEMNWIWNWRTETRKAELRRVVSTRAFQKAAGMKACGDGWDLIKNTLLAGWKADERAKAGV